MIRYLSISKQSPFLKIGGEIYLIDQEDYKKYAGQSGDFNIVPLKRFVDKKGNNVTIISISPHLHNFTVCDSNEAVHILKCIDDDCGYLYKQDHKWEVLEEDKIYTFCPKCGYRQEGLYDYWTGLNYFNPIIESITLQNITEKLLEIESKIPKLIVDKSLRKEFPNIMFETVLEKIEKKISEIEHHEMNIYKYVYDFLKFMNLIESEELGGYSWIFSHPHIIYIKDKKYYAEEPVKILRDLNIEKEYFEFIKDKMTEFEKIKEVLTMSREYINKMRDKIKSIFKTK